MTSSGIAAALHAARRSFAEGRSRIITSARLLAKRRLLLPTAVVLAAATIIPIDLISAAATGRSTVFGNTFITDEGAADPYGVYNSRLAPATGRSFVDQAHGELTFALYSAGTAPTPYPEIATGEQIEIMTELPPELRVSTTYGWCDPNVTVARNYVTPACETIDHADGSSTVRTTLTAKLPLTTATHWRILKPQTIGVVAKDGQISGTASANVTIAFPDDDDHVRNRTASVPFTTTVGTASSLSVYNANAIPNAPTTERYTHFFAGERGYLTFDTGLGAADSRGVTMRTGESFSYTLDQLGQAPRKLELDMTPDADAPFENACTRAVPGYAIRCEVVGQTIRLITTRTGPDVVDDRPVPGSLAVPVVHPEGSGFPRTIFARTVLTADMEQLGSRPLPQTTPQTTLHSRYRVGLGVNNLAVTPYVGSAFGADGLGRLTFDFLSDDNSNMVDPMMYAGDEVTMMMNLGARFNVDTEVSGPGQGDRSRNWCDQLDDWNPELAGYLGAPDCTARMDDDTGEITITVTVLALQNVSYERLEAGFQIRVRSSDASADATERISAEISSTRKHAVVAPLRRGETDVRTIDDRTSTLGVWRAEARTVSGAPGTLPEGSVSWFSDPGNATTPNFYPFHVVPGDTLVYQLTLPEGLDYTAAPTNGASNICTEPDRYGKFTGSCVIDGSTITYTLTRTGPEDWDMLSQTLPLTIPVVQSSADVPVTGDVEISFSTSITQSGSDRPRAVVPVRTPEPNSYGIHNPGLTPYVGDTFLDQSEGGIFFDFFGGDVAPAETPDVRTGEQIVITADLPASLEFTEEDSRNYGWCDPTGTLRHRLKEYADMICEVTDNQDNSSSLRLTLTARIDLPRAPAFWAAYRDNVIGVVARDGQVDGTGTARVTITFPDDADHNRTRVAEPTFTTAARP
ncbi:hypothetical protein [Plantibacter sp. YIM 135347]|uniref:hypothetical protein n=1 Tax=Plantibacter sp. YIM 135347 TaxID=3423919 RepID=UPI003D331A28